MTFPKVNNPTKILNEKIEEKTNNPKTKQHFLKKKKKGERQHYRMEAEEGSTTQKERGKSFSNNVIYNYNFDVCMCVVCVGVWVVCGWCAGVCGEEEVEL